jgi:phage tail sheath gpL-like
MPQLNPNVPTNAGPGAYFAISAKSATSVSNLQDLAGRYRVNIIADMGDSGTADADTPLLITSQAMADQYFQARSGCARGYTRVAAQVTGGVNIYCTGIKMASGTQATALLTVIGTAVGSGQIKVLIDDILTICDVADGDVANTIATNLNTALSLQTSLPLTNAVVAPTITLTYFTKGVHGNDKPIAVFIDDSITGVSISPGTLTIAGNADGAGAGHTLTCNNKTVSYDPAGTTAAQAGDAYAAAVNADSSFHLKASSNGAGVVTLLYRNGHPVHRISRTNSDGVQTATLAVGTTGSGAPTLTNALNNLASAAAMQEWVTIFNDDASLEAIIAHLRTYGNGYHMKEQFFTWGSTEGLTAAGALVSNLSPSVITPSDSDSMIGRFTEIWCPNAFQQAFELACHRASARAAQVRPTKNFNYFPLVSNISGIRLTYPIASDWPDPATSGTARATYYLCPIIVRRGNLCIESDVNTYGGTSLKYKKSSYVHGIAHYRNTAKATLEDRFGDKEYVEHSEVRTPDCFNVDMVHGALMDVKNSLEFQNLFDGAEFVEPLIDVQIDTTTPGVILVGDPVLMPVELDRIQGVISPP